MKWRKSENENDQSKETNDQDNELELLRLEALNAKRIKTQTQLNFEQLKKKSNLFIIYLFVYNWM